MRHSCHIFSTIQPYGSVDHETANVANDVRKRDRLKKKSLKITSGRIETEPDQNQDLSG